MKVYSKIQTLLIGIFLFACGATKSSDTSSIQVIPFELYENWIFIDVQINNSNAYRFLFDTGVSTTIINTKAAKELRLISSTRGELTSITGEDSLPMAKHNEIKIGDIILPSVDLMITDLHHMELSYGHTIDGIIGYDLLKNNIIQVNFEKEKIQLISEEQFSQIKKVVPVRLMTDVLLIKSKIILDNGEEIEGEFLIDTGYNSSLALNTPYVNKFNLLSRIDKYYKFRPSGVLDKEDYSIKTRIGSFIFGDYTFHNIPITLSQSKEGMLASDEIDGVIGNEILKKYNITFNYKKQLIGIEENKKFIENYKVNCSGLELKLSNDKQRIIIDKVYENSPASEIMLQRGDEIVEINGKQANKISLPVVKSMLRQAGKNVPLKIKRGNQLIETTIILRELV